MKFFVRGLLFFAALSLLLLMGEVLYRTYSRLVNGVPWNQTVSSFHDRELGWGGKKIFGDAGTKKYKIFVLGDSFTAGRGVEEQDMYYRTVEKALDAELFIYGGGGYGTLQEYMVVDKYIDSIRPDLIILQVCPNDFVNNSWELESASYFNNNLLVRPYWIDGKMEYRFPKFWGKLRVFLSDHSRLLYRLFGRMDKVCALLVHKGLWGSIEQEIRKKDGDLEDYKKAVSVTNDLMAKIKLRAGKTPIVAFPVNDDQPNIDQFRKIFIKNDIEFVETIPKEIRKVESTGVDLRLADRAHWNGEGHKICGKTLAKELIDRGYGKHKNLSQGAQLKQ